ncbi:MAG: selenide, water dikinase SelD, partial [Pseudomonadota bacterium]
LAERPPVAYDAVSINVGVASSRPPGPGFEQAAPAKPLGAFADAWEAHVAAVRDGAAAASAAVVGGGVGGVELAMAMAHRLARAGGGAGPRVALIEAAERLLPAEAPALRRRAAAALAAAGVELRLGARASAANAQGVTLEGGEAIAAAFVALAAGAAPPPGLAETGLALAAGFIRVDAHLRAIGEEAVFAAGDAAHLEDGPRPKAGVYAVRQAPVLFDNLRAAVSGRPLRRHRPQRDYLKLVSTGGRAAIASKWGAAAAAPAFWRLKDRIDQGFMRRLNAPAPAMSAPPEPQGEAATGVRALLAAAPLCGGCGSKIGPAALRAGLGAGAALGGDAAAPPGDPERVLSVDQFRAFIEDPFELARIAALHALSDVWASGAAPDAALAAVTLGPMSAEKQAETLREISAGLRAALDPAGAALIGGHSALGAEMSVGVVAAGRRPPGRPPLGLSGARPGDALILTKRLGVGALLAADMRGIGSGPELAAALAEMRRPNGPAAAILAPRACAMTDVTGFGLAGHLGALARASGLDAEIRLDAPPALDGALARIAGGIESSLAPANRADARLSAPGRAADDPRLGLLVDPQTSGGLLAAVPPEAAGAQRPISTAVTVVAMSAETRAPA